jgi:hypothetical protein
MGGEVVFNVDVCTAKYGQGGSRFHHSSLAASVEKYLLFFSAIF